MAAGGAAKRGPGVLCGGHRRQGHPRVRQAADISLLRALAVRQVGVYAKRAKCAKCTVGATSSRGQQAWHGRGAVSKRLAAKHAGQMKYL